MATHPVDEVLPPARLLAYGLQHVLAMYAGAVAVPLIVAAGLGLSRDDLVYLIGADLFTCGLATLVQTVGFRGVGARLPIMQGCTFAAVAPMVLVGRAHGLPAIYGAVIVAGALTFVAAPWFGRLMRLFPPVVTGTVVLLIGVSLLPVAARWTGGGDEARADFGAPRHLAVAAATLALVVAVERLGRPWLRTLAVLGGILGGCCIAACLGMIDLRPVADAAWLGVTTPLHFGAPRFDPASIVTMALVMLVVMVETTGDLLAVGELAGRPLDGPALARGLRADGLSTVLGGLLNAFPYTAYAQNVGLVGLTRVASRWVVATAGALLVVLGLFPKLAAVVACVPAAVLGGAGLVMFGAVAASGVATLARVRFAGTRNAVVVGVSLAVGLLPVGASELFAKLPAGLQVLLHSGITTGSVCAVALNLLVGERAADPSRSIAA